jgi:hypothetical protein
MMPLQDEQDAFDLDEKEEAANGTAMQSWNTERERGRNQQKLKT